MIVVRSKRRNRELLPVFTERNGLKARFLLKDLRNLTNYTSVYVIFHKRSLYKLTLPWMQPCTTGFRKATKRPTGGNC